MVQRNLSCAQRRKLFVTTFIVTSLLFELNPVHTKQLKQKQQPQYQLQTHKEYHHNQQIKQQSLQQTSPIIEEEEKIEEKLGSPETVEYEMKRTLSHHLRDKFPLPCTETNSYAPCKCSNLITTLNKGDSTIRFSEYKCKDNVNLQRIKMKWIPQGYECRQLLGRKIIYKDDRGNPVNKIQLYYAGCELRCTNRDCKKIIVPKQAEPLTETEPMAEVEPLTESQSIDETEQLKESETPSKSGVIEGAEQFKTNGLQGEGDFLEGEEQLTEFEPFIEAEFTNGENQLKEVGQLSEAGSVTKHKPLRNIGPSYSVEPREKEKGGLMAPSLPFSRAYKPSHISLISLLSQLRSKLKDNVRASAGDTSKPTLVKSSKSQPAISSSSVPIEFSSSFYSDSPSGIAPDMKTKMTLNIPNI